MNTNGQHLYSMGQASPQRIFYPGLILSQFMIPGGSEVQGGPQVEGTETVWKRIQI